MKSASVEQKGRSVRLKNAQTHVKWILINAKGQPFIDAFKSQRTYASTGKFKNLVELVKLVTQLKDVVSLELVLLVISNKKNVVLEMLFIGLITVVSRLLLAKHVWLQNNANKIVVKILLLANQATLNTKKFV